jgi:hypothetical protein
MKRITKLIAAFALTVFGYNNVNAQAGSYAFSASSGTFTSIVGTGETNQPLMEADTYLTPSTPLGFTFSFEGVAYTEGSQSRIESRSDSGAAGGTPSSTLRERLIVSPQTAKHCMLRRQPISSRLISGGTKTNALSPFSPSYRSTCKKASTLSNKEIRHLMNSTRKRLKQQKVKESRSPCSNE